MGAVRTVVLGLMAWGAIGAIAPAAEISSASTSQLTWFQQNWISPQNLSGNMNTGVVMTSWTSTSSSAVISVPTLPAPSDPASSSSSSSASTTPAPVAPSASSGATNDGYINFSNGPFPEAGSLTNGGAQAWFNSPAVQQVFGGTPNAQQQASFENQVLQDVEKTYSLAGMNPTFTTDPNAHANHTISVVSGTSYSPNPQAIGITDVGGNGFAFIDKFAYATSVSDLAMALAHNISHEMMHAFGVAVHHDQTGTYVDTGTATWTLLTNPNATFSPAAAQDILSHNFGRDLSALAASGAQLIDGDQVLILPSPIPEPTTLALWGLAGTGALLAWRRNQGRAAA